MDNKLTRKPNGTFASGQSGNPGGRKKNYVEVQGEIIHTQELFRRYGAHVNHILLNIIDDEKTPVGVKVQAIKEWNDRAFGKPVANIDITTNSPRIEGKVDVAALDDDTKRKLLLAVRTGEQGRPPKAA